MVTAIGASGRSAAIGERPKVLFRGLAELEGVVARLERRVAEIDGEPKSLRENAVDPVDVGKKLTEFEGVWEVVYPQEQVQIVTSVIAAVTCIERDEVRIEFSSHKPFRPASS